MTVRQWVIAGAVVVAASSLSAVIAYRSGARSAAPPPAVAPSAAAAAASPAGRASAGSASDGSVEAKPSRGCVDFSQAGSHTGETRCVAGRILRVYASRAGNTFFDFCADYRSCPFTSVVFSSDRSKFGDLATLGGRKVELQGPITAYQGRAEIVVHDPKQLRVLP